MLAVGLGMFAAIVWAVRYHFASNTKPLGFLIVSVLSVINLAWFGHLLWRYPKSTAQLSIVLALFLAAAALFFSAVSASRRARLRLLFDPSQPDQLLESGPYRYIRHPFYTSYLLYWLGCAIATAHPVNIGFFVLLVPLLMAGARAEEESFAQSPLAQQYADYRRRTGRFWPRLRRAAA